MPGWQLAQMNVAQARWAAERAEMAESAAEVAGGGAWAGCVHLCFGVL